MIKSTAIFGGQIYVQFDPKKLAGDTKHTYILRKQSDTKVRSTYWIGSHLLIFIV